MCSHCVFGVGLRAVADHDILVLEPRLCDLKVLELSEPELGSEARVGIRQSWDQTLAEQELSWDMAERGKGERMGTHVQAPVYHM